MLVHPPAHLHGDVIRREGVEDVAAHIKWIGEVTCGINRPADVSKLMLQTSA
jgi:hypothetical protein